MTIPEESRAENLPAANGIWQRRVLQAPHLAKWVPESFQKLTLVPSMPSMRELRLEADGSWSVEEYFTASHFPLADYLTRSSAPVWVFVSIVQQCLAGLVSLHECGLMHGVLSPESVRVDDTGNVRLAGCCAGSVAPPWPNGTAAADTAPALPHSLAMADLRDLGRVFRAVLGGDAETKMTISHPEIAPLVAEWIDWIAEPAAGREAASVAHAEEVFSDIRTGRPGWKPWRDRVRLPMESFGEHHHAELTEEERAKLRRAAAQAHDSGAEWHGIALVGLIILALAAGTTWAINYFAKDEPVPVSSSEPAVIASRAPAHEKLVLLPDESSDVFHASDGDVEPLADTADTIMKLMGVLEGDKPSIPKWDLALERQAAARAKAADGKSPKEIPDGEAFLASTQIFPFMGRASAGRTPGDYYLVWRTQRLVLTWEECRELQIAILRSARYCGVRLLAWTVLPNQAGVVLRVPAPRPLSDERLARRIAILRGEKTAASVIAQIDDKLKAGDEEGAKKVRLTWTASMNSAAGFYGVIRTVPVVKPEFLKGVPLWRDKPLHLSVLDSATPDVLRAAAAVDTAALTAELVESASAWPLCSLSAAIHNYGPAVRAISVLMQRNPQASLPLPGKDDLKKSLRDYRIYLGDLTEDSPAVSAPDSGDPSRAKEKATKVD